MIQILVKIRPQALACGRSTVGPIIVSQKRFTIAQVLAAPWLQPLPGQILARMSAHCHQIGVKTAIDRMEIAQKAAFLEKKFAAPP
jgi:hypothetical protein